LPVETRGRPSQAQRFSVEELARRAVERRAVEAVIWGLPAVNFDLLYQAMVQAKGGWNQIVFWSRLPDWKNQTLTPNPDTIYLFPFISTKDVGPMVLDIPPADEGSISSLQNCFTDIPLRCCAAIRSAHSSALEAAPLSPITVSVMTQLCSAWPPIWKRGSSVLTGRLPFSDVPLTVDFRHF